VAIVNGNISHGEKIDDLLIALPPDQPKHDNVHVPERINLSFQLQITVVADALNLTPFKVAGVLPILALNVSNSNTMD